MNIKGNAFLARKSLVEQEFGEKEWAGFIKEYSKKDPFFADTIYALTQIPAEKFLAFNDTVRERFYPGRDANEVLWAVGEKSVEFALSEGQLRGIFKPGEYDRFLRFAPNIWKGYYSEGEASVHAGPSGSTELKIRGVPNELRHGYFEFVAMAFMKRGVELLGAKVKHEAVKSFSRGDDESLYRFIFS
jgi:hypothetical protein